MWCANINTEADKTQLNKQPKKRKNISAVTVTLKNNNNIYNERPDNSAVISVINKFFKDGNKNDREKY